MVAKRNTNNGTKQMLNQLNATISLVHKAAQKHQSDAANAVLPETVLIAYACLKKAKELFYTKSNDSKRHAAAMKQALNAARAHATAALK